MKVRELIELLQAEDQELEVYSNDGYGDEPLVREDVLLITNTEDGVPYLLVG